MSPEMWSWRLSGRAAAAPGDARRLALIEDDEQVRESLALFLKRRGFLIEAYPSAMDFLHRPRRPKLACLLIDFRMARVNGIELLQTLRAQGDKTPALLITGLFSSTLRARALAAGFTDVVEKPAMAEKLEARIAAIVKET
ncbi:MAG: response regulator [Henriciella sp.]